MTTYNFMSEMIRWALAYWYRKNSERRCQYHDSAESFLILGESLGENVCVSLTFLWFSFLLCETWRIGTCGFQEPHHWCSRRDQGAQHAVTRLLLPMVKGTQQMSRWKRQGKSEEPDANIQWTIPVGSHRMCLILSATSYGKTSKMFHCGKSP